MADFLIEDTYDWLDSPTPLETCQHQLLMSENEIQELTTQLRQERERIFKLVEIHGQATKECEALRSQLAAARTEASEASRRASDIETKSAWELMAKDKHITELSTQIKILNGEDPFASRFPHHWDTDRA